MFRVICILILIISGMLAIGCATMCHDCENYHNGNHNPIYPYKISEVKCLRIFQTEGTSFDVYEGFDKLNSHQSYSFDDLIVLLSGPGKKIIYLSSMDIINILRKNGDDIFLGENYYMLPSFIDHDWGVSFIPFTIFWSNVEQDQFFCNEYYLGNDLVKSLEYAIDYFAHSQSNIFITPCYPLGPAKWIRTYPLSRLNYGYMKHLCETLKKRNGIYVYLFSMWGDDRNVFCMDYFSIEYIMNDYKLEKQRK